MDEQISKPKSGVVSRQLAVELLKRVDSGKAYSNVLLSNAFKQKSLSERDRAFVTALVQGVLRHRDGIDAKLSQLSSRPLSQMPDILRNILRIAIFQIDHMPDIPQSAVVDTSNELGKRMGHAGLAKFINGVLRNYLRRRETITIAPPGESEVDHMAAIYSMPPWLVSRWLGQFGPRETAELLRQSQQVPELVLRVCEMSITAQGLQKILEGRGVKTHRGRLVESCLIVDDRGPLKGPIQKLPGYDEGLFVVQDEAAAFVSRVVDPKAGELVIDLCAAPGGKALHMGELMENRGRVIAIDDHAPRLDLLKETRQRLGLTNIETVVCDGRSFKSDKQADRLLLDAPCTGTGVINRRSDLRYHREAPDLVRLVELQRQLLDNAASLVKPGGILVYSTCSVEPEENIDNYKWFLDKYPNFRPDSLQPFFPPDVLADWSAKDLVDPAAGCIQLLPSRHGVSGFFIARLKNDA